MSQVRRLHDKPFSPNSIYTVQATATGTVAIAAAVGIVPWLGVAAVGLVGLVAALRLGRAGGEAILFIHGVVAAAARLLRGLGTVAPGAVERTSYVRSVRGGRASFTRRLDGRDAMALARDGRVARARVLVSVGGCGSP